jgi:hypothetical protein
MILVRDVFQLKYGKAREAIAIWKEGMALFKKLTVKPHDMRLLTDLVGNYYTLVFETTFESLAQYERLGESHIATDEWKAWHAKVGQVSEGGHREIFNIVA